MGYKYNFPQNRRAGGYKEQLKHAAGEVVEASLEASLDNAGIDMSIEILDAIECLEGALRDIEGSFPGATSVAYVFHRAKNNARGDYDV